MGGSGPSRSESLWGSLFLRTAVYSAFVTILTLTAFGLRFIMHEREVLLSHLQESAGSLLLAVDSLYAGAVTESDLPAAMEQPSGRVQAGELVNGQVFHGSQPVQVAGQLGWLHIGLSMDNYHAGLRSLLQIVLDLAGPGLLIGVLMSFLFANRLTRPISELKTFASHVASGDLESRVNLHSNTELGILGDTMNRMVSDLQQSRSTEKEAMAKEGQLREQEILPKEIHHRVQNNLQILSSLLRMQARKASTDEMKGMLKESELRIRSMGLLHEKLYQSNSLSTVDFKSYVDTLSGQLLRMHTSEEQPDLDVDIDDVLLPLDTARPCGLIINELVSNSLKYAFNDGRKGRIAIKVSPTGESAYQLRVSDNGVGMKKMPVPGERRSSLGMSLVEMLVDQLNGAVEFRNGDGTTADIQFKETVYTNRM